MEEFEAKKIDKLLGEEYVQGYLFNNENTGKPRKASKAEINLRIRTIRNLLIKGLNRKAIIEYCELRFEIKKKQVYKYLKIIDEELVEESKKQSGLNYAMAVERYEDVLRETILAKDTPNRIKALNSLDKINGLVSTNHKLGVGEDGDTEFKLVFESQTKEESEKDSEDESKEI